MSGEVEILEEPLERLAEHARISIAYRVERVLEIGPGLTTIERLVAEPQTKDYDALPGNSPEGWPDQFDCSNWGLLAAWSGGERVGGAVLAFDTPGVDLLEGRRDLSVLWDLRVAPRARGRGVGSALFAAAEAWARDRGCSQLKIETQDVNVPACRFYASCGCVLRAANAGAYPDLPDETQLLWYKDL